MAAIESTTSHNPQCCRLFGYLLRSRKNFYQLPHTKSHDIQRCIVQYSKNVSQCHPSRFLNIFWKNVALHFFIPNRDICWRFLLSGAFHYYVWNVEAIKNSTQGHYVHKPRSTVMINRPVEYGLLCHIVQASYRCCTFTTHLSLYHWTKQTSAAYHKWYRDPFIKARHYSNVRRKYYAGPGS